jgi:hypothetical protein
MPESILMGGVWLPIRSRTVMSSEGLTRERPPLTVGA